MARIRVIDLRPVLISLSMLTVILGLMATLLAGCNTTEGFGKDVKSAGSGIEHSAEKNK